MTTVSSDARAVLLTGGLGTGKTAVAIEVGELLEAAGAPYAVVDLDWLCWAWTPALADGGVHELLCANLRAMLPNLHRRGVRHLVLARAVLTADGLAALRDALAPTPLTVVRLTASDEQVQTRLAGRDAGARLEGHLSRRASYEQMVASAAPDAVVVDTSGQDPAHVASDLVVRLGWPLPGQ
jgi:chloramphenicol 3-O-phosphotransferase